LCFVCKKSKFVFLAMFVVWAILEVVESQPLQDKAGIQNNPKTVFVCFGFRVILGVGESQSAMVPKNKNWAHAQFSNRRPPLSTSYERTSFEGCGSLATRTARYGRQIIMNFTREPLT
jgi:hypothetical protein